MNVVAARFRGISWCHTIVAYSTGAWCCSAKGRSIPVGTTGSTFVVQVQKEAIQSVEQDGMVFIDEIDKIVVNHDSRYGMAW